MWIVGLRALDRTSRSRARSSARSTAPTVSWLLSNVYMAAQLVVLPGTLFALYRWARPVYQPAAGHRARDLDDRGPDPRALAGRAAAPGRHRHRGHGERPARLALRALDDLLQRVRGRAVACTSGSRSRSASRWPRRCPQRWAKALALLWGPLVTLAVVATGNHFVFDAVAGLVVTGAGFAVGTLLPRVAHHWSEPRAGRAQRSVRPSVARADAKSGSSGSIGSSSSRISSGSGPRRSPSW